MTAHTTNPVPVIVTKEGVTLREGGILGDLAPTLLRFIRMLKTERNDRNQSLIK